MPYPPRSYDVWFVAANTVYKGVPYHVVADWTRGGRLAAADQLRPAGTAQPWQPLTQFPLFADYLPAPEPLSIPDDEGNPLPIPIDEPETVDLDFTQRKHRADEDDDPDMIPLIDISLVLLIFFMMIRAAGMLSPVDVPDMVFAGELSKDADAITLSIEKKSADEVFYTVRVGQQPPRPQYAKLPTPESALAALREVLAEAVRPPEVRIACDKTLPSERVFELTLELKKLRDKNLVSSYTAEVNEQAKKP